MYHVLVTRHDDACHILSKDAKEKKKIFMPSTSRRQAKAASYACRRRVGAPSFRLAARRRRRQRRRAMRLYAAVDAGQAAARRDRTEKSPRGHALTARRHGAQQGAMYAARKGSAPRQARRPPAAAPSLRRPARHAVACTRLPAAQVVLLHAHVPASGSAKDVQKMFKRSKRAAKRCS